MWGILAVRRLGHERGVPIASVSAKILAPDLALSQRLGPVDSPPSGASLRRQSTRRSAARTTHRGPIDARRSLRLSTRRGAWRVCRSQVALEMSPSASQQSMTSKACLSSNSWRPPTFEGSGERNEKTTSRLSSPGLGKLGRSGLMQRRYRSLEG